MSQLGSVPLTLRTRSRARLRQGFHRIGGFDLWRHWKAGKALTVLLLHRIVPDGAEPETDPGDCLTASLFEAVLAVLSRQYHFIGLMELLDWVDGKAGLPDRPLLLTFDDGWADTVLLARSALRRAGLPAAVFVATDALADPNPVWWQEASRIEACSTTIGLLDRLCALGRDPSAREALLARRLAVTPPPPRHMLRPDDLAELVCSDIAIGTHAAAHLPLTRLADKEVAEDLARARQALSAWLGEDAKAQTAALRCLAFPHGRWDARVLALARKAGFDVLFSSEPCLNPLAWPPVLPFGRIPLAAAAVVGPDGRLAPDRLAAWLLARPSRVPNTGPS